jgi:hypothetical protein
LPEEEQEYRKWPIFFVFGLRCYGNDKIVCLTKMNVMYRIAVRTGLLLMPFVLCEYRPMIQDRFYVFNA